MGAIQELRDTRAKIKHLRDRPRFREVITNTSLLANLKKRPAIFWETPDTRGGPAAISSATDGLSQEWEVVGEADAEVERDMDREANQETNNNQCRIPSPAGRQTSASHQPELFPNGPNHSERSIHVGNDGIVSTERRPSGSLKSSGSQLLTETGGSTAGVQSIKPVLQSLQRTHENVMQHTLKMYDVREPLATSLATLMPSLGKVIIDLTSLLNSTGISNDLSQEVSQLEDNFSHVKDVQYEAFVVANEQYERQENDLVPVLWRTSRYLEKLLGAHENEPMTHGLLPVLSSTQGPDDVPLEDTHYSPALLQFLSKTGDVEALREKLADLRFEHEQILSDKEAREQLGVSLDEDSLAFLDSFDKLYQTLLDEWHSAEATLDSLRRYLTDEEIYTLSAPDPSHSPINEDAIMEDYPDLLDLASQQDSRVDEPNPVLPQLQREPAPIRSYLDPSKPTPIDPTDFINAWMLNELQSSPLRWRTFSSSLGQVADGVEAQHLDLLIRDTWFNDISPSELAQRRRFADQQSMEQNEADSQHHVPRSAIMVANASNSLPLLKLSSTVAANDIMARARQARSLKYYND